MERSPLGGRTCFEAVYTQHGERGVHYAVPVRAAPRVFSPPKRPVKRDASSAPSQAAPTVVAEVAKEAATGGGDRSRRGLPQRSASSRGARATQPETVAATAEPPRVWRGRAAPEPSGNHVGTPPLKASRPASKDARAGRRAHAAPESVPNEVGVAPTNGPRPSSNDARAGQTRNLQSSGSLSRRRDLPWKASAKATPQHGLPKRASPLSSSQQFLTMRASPDR